MAMPWTHPTGPNRKRTSIFLGEISKGDFFGRGIARQKLGYSPLPQNEAERIRRFLSFLGDAVSVLDPCAGGGAAMATITSGAKTVRHAIELDAFRAEEARSLLDHVIQGNCFDVHSAVDRK